MMDKSEMKDLFYGLCFYYLVVMFGLLTYFFVKKCHGEIFYINRNVSPISFSFPVLSTEYARNKSGDLASEYSQYQLLN